MSVSALSSMDTLFYSPSHGRKLEEWNLICPVSHETLADAVSLSPCWHLINLKVAQKLFDGENEEVGDVLGHCPECRVKVRSYQEEEKVRSVVNRVFQKDVLEINQGEPPVGESITPSKSSSSASSEDGNPSLHGAPPFILAQSSDENEKIESLKESLHTDIEKRGCFLARQELSVAMERETFFNMIERHSELITNLEIPKSLREEFSDNDLKTIVLQLSGLKGLNLCACKNITGEGLKVLSELKNLSVLGLENCEQLVDEDLGSLGECPNLARLDISGCKKLTDKVFESIGAVRSLRHLFMKRLPLLKGSGLSELTGPGRPEISSLDLSDCVQIGDGAIDLLKDFSSLERLCLTGLKTMSNAALESLKSLSELKELRLSGTNIDNAGLEQIAKLTTLTSLGLRNCSKVTVSSLEEKILGQIPQICRVYFDNDELFRMAKEKQEDRYLHLAARMLNEHASEVVNQEIPYRDTGDINGQIDKLDAEISLLEEASKALKLAVDLIAHPNHSLNLSSLEVFKLPELLRTKAELHIRQAESLEEGAWEGKRNLYEQAIVCFEKSLEKPTDTKWRDELLAQERIKSIRQSTEDRLILARMEAHRQKDLMMSDPTYQYKNRRFSISISIAAPLSCCQYAKDYKKSEHLDEALKYFYVALEKGLLAGKQMDCYTHMAEIYLKKDMAFAAEKLLLNVLETSDELGLPIDPDVYFHLAKAYKNLFEKYPDFTHIRVKSISYFQKMLHRARPNCPSIKEAEEALESLQSILTIEL